MKTKPKRSAKYRMAKSILSRKERENDKPAFLGKQWEERRERRIAKMMGLAK